MRRPLIVLSMVFVALTAVACSASAAPGWTYAPPTEPPASQAAPSGGASAAPSVGPSAAPSVETPSQVPGGGGTVVQVSALNIAYEQSQISAPAGTAFTIHFDNKDPGVPHNVAIKDASGAEVFKGNIITGPAQADYQVPALQPGTYTFTCSVHPSMTGTLTVGN